MAPMPSQWLQRVPSPQTGQEDGDPYRCHTRRGLEIAAHGERERVLSYYHHSMHASPQRSWLTQEASLVTRRRAQSRAPCDTLLEQGHSRERRAFFVVVAVSGDKPHVGKVRVTLHTTCVKSLYKYYSGVYPQTVPHAARPRGGPPMGTRFREDHNFWISQLRAQG